MSILAGCMIALCAFVFFCVCLVLLLDVWDSHEKAKQHEATRLQIIRDLQRKEDIDWLDTHPRCGPPT